MKLNMKLDHIDKIILKYLQEDAQMTSAEIASRVKLSASGVQKRLRRLFDSKLVKHVVAVLDREEVGYDMLCFMHVLLAAQKADATCEFNEAIQSMPEILECHRMIGDCDYLLKVTVRDRDHLDDFMTHRLLGLNCVSRVNTHIVLKEIKETTALRVME